MDGMGTDNYINANYINVKTRERFRTIQLQINVIGCRSSESLYRHPRTKIFHDQRFLEDDLAGTSSDDCYGHEFRRKQRSLFVPQSNV
jgi:hypothetical protein